MRQDSDGTKDMEDRRPSRTSRLELMFLVAAFGVLGLLGRVFYLQTALHEAFAAEASANAYREVQQPVPRGRILDREGRELATSRASLTVSLLYHDEETLERRLPALTGVVGVAPEDILRAVTKADGLLFAPVVIARDVDQSTYTNLAERADEFPELRLGWEPRRDYPFGPSAAHLIGYLGEVSLQDVSIYPDVYSPGDVRGQAGVEAACDWLLRGRPGVTTYEVDAEGRAAGVISTVSGTAGLDIRLTIDADLQAVAFESLGQAMEKARRDSDGTRAAPGGAVVALDPRTGEVLALVSRPSFYPDVFTPPSSTGAVEDLSADPLTPLLNRAIGGIFAPGSTFKLVTATAALEEGVTDEAEVIVDTGRHWLIPKKCWKAGGHGVVDLRRALMWSCNVYFYEMGLRVGIDGLAKWAEAYGLGRPTGIDLSEGHRWFGPGRTGPATAGGLEAAGTVPSSALKAEVFPEDPVVWPAEEMDAAIGQGFNAYTPLQMAVLTAAIANGGTLWRPWAISAVVDASGQPINEAGPEAAAPGTVAVSEATLRAVREGMLGVTMSGGSQRGTAGYVFGPAFRQRWGVDVAGKTGTAEHGEDSGLADDAWFVGYAPYDDPQIVVVVIIQQGGGGTATSAPVAKAIFEAWLAKRGPS